MENGWIATSGRDGTNWRLSRVGFSSTSFRLPSLGQTFDSSLFTKRFRVGFLIAQRSARSPASHFDLHASYFRFRL